MNNPNDSAFDRIIALGYYDGATSGLAHRRRQPDAFRFELAAWDVNGENRVFSLSKVSSTIFESVAGILARIEEPRWPYWVPTWRFKSESEEQSITADLNEILAKIAPPTIVIATEDMDKPFAHLKEIGQAERNRLPLKGTLPSPADWQYWKDFLHLA